MVEKENIDPSQILALTFSKEAARHMREKVEKLLQGKEIHVKTFHSFCARLSRIMPTDAKFRRLQDIREIDSAIFIFRNSKSIPGPLASTQHDRKSQRPEYLDK